MNGYDQAQLGGTEPTYLRTCGLAEAPFSVASDPRFFYADTGRVQQIQLLQHLIDFSEVLVLITGERGSGKSSLMQHFAAEAPERWQVCCIDVHALMSADQLILAIARGFGVELAGSEAADPNEALYLHLLALHRSYTIPVLLVDNAHDLPEDALEAVFHLTDVQSADGQRLLRTVMFCEPGIEKRLESGVMKPLRERVTHTMEIPRLREEDVAQYLRHRLTVAGWRGTDLPFSPRDIHRICKSAQGLPGRVNHEAHLALSKAATATEPRGDRPLARLPRLPHARMLVIAAVVVVVGVLLALQSRINTWFSGDASPPAAAPGLTAPDAADRVTVPLPVFEEKASPPTEEPDLGANGGPKSPPLTPLAELGEPLADAPPPLADESEAQLAPDETAPVATPEAGEVTPAEPSPPALSLATIEPNLVEGRREPQTLTLRGSGFSERTVVTVLWADREKALPPGQVSLDSAEQMRIRITTGVTPGQWRVSLTDPQTAVVADGTFAVVAPALPSPPPVAASPQPVPAAAALSLHGRDWVLAQDPEHFTAQLFASYDRPNVEAFARTNSLTGDAAIYETRHNDRPWFVLVHGSYASKDAARLGVAALPAAVGRAKPWIRRLDSVQATLTAPVAATGGAAAQPAPAPAPRAPQALQASSHEAWLWGQDPRHFTLQLMGSRSEANIKSFIKRHDLEGKVAYFHSRHEGRDWYAAVYGIYPDRAAAEQAAKALPAALRELSPWVRSFSSIHDDLHQAAP